MKSSRREALTAYLFALPWIIGFSFFLLYPLSASIYYSFCDYSVLRPPVWIGLANYTGLLHDDVFKNHADQHPVLRAGLAAARSGGGAGAGAAAQYESASGLTLYRTMFYLPSLVPMVALACLWLWLFNGENGLINQALTPLLHPVRTETAELVERSSVVEARADSNWSVGDGERDGNLSRGTAGRAGSTLRSGGTRRRGVVGENPERHYTHAVAGHPVQSDYGNYWFAASLHDSLRDVSGRLTGPIHLLLYDVFVRQRLSNTAKWALPARWAGLCS